MCLHNAKKISQEGEIKCYKVLVALGGRGGFYSPYYTAKTHWNINETMTAKFCDESDESSIIDGHGRLHSGAFHTFLDRQDARDYAYSNLTDRYRVWEIFIAECIIPKDNRYLYKGDVKKSYTSKMLEGYASEKLKVVDIKRLEE